MTTPAVNINATQMTPGYLEVHYWDGSVYRPPSSLVPTRKKFRQRPESVSHRPNPISGWRDAGSWYHRGYDCNPMPLGTIRETREYGNLVIWGDGLGWTTQGATQCPGVPSKISSLAEARALSALKNQKVNLAVAFAERKETAEFVTDALHGLASVAKALRRKNPKDWRRALSWNRGNTEDRLRKVPESYLSFMYAARPLVGDTYGACDALNSRERDSSSSPYVVNVKGKAKAVVRSSYRKVSDIATQIGFTVQVSEVFKAFVSLNYVLVNPLTASLASVGITNPLEILWERMPLSFVADWFVPVGGYLSQLDADLGYEFRSGTFSLKATRSETGFFQLLGGYPYAVSYSGPDWRYEGFDFVRGLYSETPMPWTGLKNPFPKNGVHIAEAIALLAANLRS